MDRESQHQDSARNADVATSGYHAFMKVVGIKMLKDRLSEFVRLVQAGETVLVTDRDEVVAELVPPRPDRARLVSDVALLEDIRRGLVTPATRRGPLTFPRRPIAPTAEILRQLREDRDAR
jgi:antitoxin (DNA-binding transcriptional repressor) of toxin-antitoxin stability system